MSKLKRKEYVSAEEVENFLISQGNIVSKVNCLNICLLNIVFE